MEMPKTVKMADLSARVAARILVAYNHEVVTYVRINPFSLSDPGCGAIVSFVEPAELIYPEGWYFAKGHFRNKGNSTSGRYEEIPMYQPGGEPWE